MPTVPTDHHAYFGGKRVLVTGGARKGRYQYRVDAEEAALGLAARMAKTGHAVSIFVQQPFGELLLLKAA